MQIFDSKHNDDGVESGYIVAGVFFRVNISKMLYLPK